MIISIGIEFSKILKCSCHKDGMKIIACQLWEPCVRMFTEQRLGRTQMSIDKRLDEHTGNSQQGKQQ